MEESKKVKLINLNYQLQLIKEDKKRLAKNINQLRLTTFWTFLYAKDLELSKNDRADNLKKAFKRRRKMIAIELKLHQLNEIKKAVNKEISKIVTGGI
jgi:NAD-dependent DNA ligase